MSWHYLLEQEEASWAGNSLDGAPSALLRLMPTPEASSSPDNATGALNHSQSGTTLSHSTASRGADALMSSAEDSPARTYPSQEKGKESREREAVSGKNLRECFAKYDRGSHSWKTLQCLWEEDLALSSETWPNWGLMHDGELSEALPPDFVLTESASGFSLQGPIASDQLDCRFRLKSLLRWHHPNGNLKEQFAQRFLKRITPELTAILMDWPETWTVCDATATDKCLSWFTSHGVCLEAQNAERAGVQTTDVQRLQEEVQDVPMSKVDLRKVGRERQ
jgi:hypothetical protein